MKNYIILTLIISASLIGYFLGRNSCSNSSNKIIEKDCECCYEWDVKFYSSGKISDSISYKTIHGRKVMDGYHKSFYKSGKIKTEAFYVNDKKTGHEAWCDEDGRIKAVTDNKDGKQHGYSVIYHDNGKIKQEDSFYMGNQVRATKYFDSLGNRIDRNTNP